MNRKKIQRLWREEGLRVPAAEAQAATGSASSTVPAARLRAERPDHVWALDFQFDTTTDGRAAEAAARRRRAHPRSIGDPRSSGAIDADHTVRVLDQIVAERGRRPELVRMDNGPEMTANALRDWCRFGGSGS